MGCVKILKAELIDKTWKRVEEKIEKKNVEEIVNGFLACFADELRDGNDILLTGIGTFSHKTRKEHVGKNVNTGEEEYVPETQYIRFKPSKNIKK